jgi:ubiquinone/menaquinone biosynthesis C-methylase UbiE
MDSKYLKFENPVRLAELSPGETLKRVGLEEGMVLCDIGAGSGVFTLPAAQLTKKTVYALDVNDGALATIREKASTLGLENVKTVKVSGDGFDIADSVADIALMVTVLHEIERRPAFISETARLLKTGGKAVVIEFYNRETPMGPPAWHRIDEAEVMDLFANSGFSAEDRFPLGENLYCQVFVKI